MFNCLKIYAGCILILFAALQHCMEPESESKTQLAPIVIIQKDQAITDEQLLDLVQHVDKSFLINFIKFYIQEKNISLTPEAIKSLFQLTPEAINTLFLDNVENEFLRECALSLGADINTLSSGGSNCLFRTNDPRIVKALLARGAKVDGHKNDITPLYWHFSVYKLEDVALAELFLTHGANPEDPNDPGRSLLHSVIERSNEALVKLLCQHKANVHQKDSLQYTPLMRAVEKRNVAIVNILLEHRAAQDVNVPTQFGDYPLYEAVSTREDWRTHKYKQIVPAIVISLLEQGADPNKRHERDENYPLHCVLENVRGPETKGIVEAFIKHKVNLELCDREKRRPLELAQDLRHSQDIIDLLAKFTLVKAAVALPVNPTRQPLPNPNEQQPQKSWFPSLW